MSRTASTARRLACTVVCAALTLCVLAAPAAADSSDPLFTFFADPAKEGATHSSYPPSAGGFEGPCGIALYGGLLYVADHYRDSVDVFSSSRNYLTRQSQQSEQAGPCGIAVGAGGALYVNYYHQGVVRYLPSAFPVTSKTTYGPGQVIDSTPSTGIAIDPASGRLYVNHRTYIAVYDSAGEPVLEGGSLVDGYGIAFSNNTATKGFLYVADAADATIKVYDTASGLGDPVAVIDGSETPAGSFLSLRDAAVAVDSSTGEVYVVDNLQPEGYERPEAAVYAFDRTGHYDGRFKYNVVHSNPPGLAAAGGTVYVTSGNSLGAAIYAYREAALTAAVFPAPEAAPAVAESAPPALVAGALAAADAPLDAGVALAAGVSTGDQAGPGQQIAGPKEKRKKKRKGAKRRRHRGRSQR